MSMDNDDGCVEAALASHHLSKRAAHNFAYRDVWGPRETSMGSPWSPENPDGTVILRLAENSLLHDEVAKFIKAQITVTPLEHLTYSTGPRGSRRLRRAAAAFLTEEFHSCETITADNIFVTPGLASAIDALTWSICDEDDGISIPRPFYNGFTFDTLNRSNVQPLKTFEEFASFCGKYNMHFISDEIYAKSVFPNDTIPNPTPFISILSLNLRGIIDAELVHILYGASKDFCANGLRRGLVCTNNVGVLGAMSSISMFSWSPHVLQDVWAAMLEDREWTSSFMRRKLQLMVDNYSIATSFLIDRGINHYPSNAGLFIWLDLRHLLTPKSSLYISDHDKLEASSFDAAAYRKREQMVEDIVAKNGVIIAPGSVYMPEEFGWFRITFTVGKQALVEGLKRLEKSLIRLETEIKSLN